MGKPGYGCDVIRGYHYSAPVTAEDLVAMKSRESVSSP